MGSYDIIKDILLIPYGVLEGGIKEIPYNSPWVARILFKEFLPLPYG